MRQVLNAVKHYTRTELEALVGTDAHLGHKDGLSAVESLHALQKKMTKKLAVRACITALLVIVLWFGWIPKGALHAPMQAVCILIIALLCMTMSLNLMRQHTLHSSSKQLSYFINFVRFDRGVHEVEEEALEKLKEEKKETAKSMVRRATTSNLPQGNLPTPSRARHGVNRASICRGDQVWADSAFRSSAESYETPVRPLPSPKPLPLPTVVSAGGQGTEPAAPRAALPPPEGSPAKTEGSPTKTEDSPATAEGSPAKAKKPPAGPMVNVEKWAKGRAGTIRGYH